MKILFLSPLPPPNGGIAHWSTIVSNYGNKNGDSIKIIDTSPKIRAVDGRTKVQRVVKGIKSISVIYCQLIKSLREDAPDVVHICTSGSLAFYRDYVMLKYLKRKGIKSVYHLHFGRIPYLKSQNNKEWKLFLKNAHMTGAVVAMNKFTYEALNGVIPKEKLFNVPNPIHVEKLPEYVEYEDHNKHVLYLGWFQKNKGSEELLRAWKEIKNEVSDWKLRVVGPVNWEYKKQLDAEGLCDEVDFVGEVEHSQAMEIMKKAGLFVLPSHSEGFPNVILEAMTLKVPIVATKVGAIPEMLEESGMLVEPKNVKDLAYALKTIIKDEPFRKLSADLAYKKVLSNYNLSLVYTLYLEIWKGLAYGK